MRRSRPDEAKTMDYRCRLRPLRRALRYAQIPERTYARLQSIATESDVVGARGREKNAWWHAGGGSHFLPYQNRTDHRAPRHLRTGGARHKVGQSGPGRARVAAENVSTCPASRRAVKRLRMRRRSKKTKGNIRLRKRHFRIG